MSDINLLSDICFAYIFSHSAGGLFALLMVSFVLQKLFSLVYFHVFIFYCNSVFFKCHSQKKSLPRPMSMSFIPVFFQEFYGFVSHLSL